MKRSLFHSASIAVGMLVCVVVVGSSAEAAPKNKKKKPAQEAAKTETVGEFDRQAAATALGEVNLQKCKATNAAKGDGHVTITFSPDGAVQNALVDRGPWIGTPVAKCLVKEFKKAKVPAFKGEAVTVGKSFHFE